MGRIIKYDKAKPSGSGRVQTIVSTGYPTNSGATTDKEISCNLWGNDFDGKNDIKDSMEVNGDIYLKFDPDDFDDSDFTDDEGNVVDDLPTGSLYADGKIEARKSVYGKTIYLDYPEKVEDIIDEDGEITQDDSNKTDLLDVLKDHDSKLDDHEGRISANEGKIADHESRISTNTTNISNLTTRVSNAETNINNNATNITNLTTRVSNNETEITNLWEAVNAQDTSSPVVLFSGSIHANNQDTSSTNYQPWNVRPNMYSQHIAVQGIELNYFEVNGEKKPMLVIKVNAKDGYTIKPTSVVSSVTLNSHWNPTVDFGGNRRSQGFWTTGGVWIDGNIYINVWRTHDDNNDSTTNDCIAWSVQEMNVTIFGRAYKNP